MHKLARRAALRDGLREEWVQVARNRIISLRTIVHR